MLALADYYEKKTQQPDQDPGPSTVDTHTGKMPPKKFNKTKRADLIEDYIRRRWVTDKGKGKLYTLHDVAAPAPDGDIDSGSESDVEMFDGPESPSQGKQFDEMEFDSDDRDDPNWEPSDVKMDDDS